MSEYLRSKIQEFGQLKQASLRKLASTPTARSVRAMQIINDAILPTGEEIVMQAKLAGAVVNEVEIDGHIEHTKIAHPSYADIPYYLHDLPYSESELQGIQKHAIALPKVPAAAFRPPSVRGVASQLAPTMTGIGKAAKQTANTATEINRNALNALKGQKPPPYPGR